MSAAFARDPLDPRRARMTADDVRETMLTTAAHLVNERGLTVSLQHIPLDAIVAMSGVARSAVYRIWPRRDQFFEDLLLELAAHPESSPSVLDGPTLDAALTALADITDHFPELLTTEQGREQAIVEVCRQGAQTNYDSIERRRTWRTYMSLSAAVLSYSEPMRGKLEREIQKTQQRFIDQMSRFYNAMGPALGRKLRPEFVPPPPAKPWSTLAASGSAVMEGMVLRSTGTMAGLQAPAFEAGPIPFDPFATGFPAKWSPPALSFTSMLLAMTQGVPNEEYAEIPIEVRINAATDVVRELKAEIERDRRRV
ncbi:TetR/AcrR family transcriptional regulator [Nocardia sp. NPDC051052]|uniref:TetR/AcrR family transcriptional regulator n=1 Tax=Nocardia sp. NPDC051052 TaxID=3364322 RepID=UPI00378B0529